MFLLQSLEGSIIHGGQCVVRAGQSNSSFKITLFKLCRHTCCQIQYLRESSGEKRPLLGLGPRPGGGSASSLSCLLTAIVRDLRHPPLSRCPRQRVLKYSKRTHEAWSFLTATASRMVANFCPASPLEALGNRLRNVQFSR